MNRAIPPSAQPASGVRSGMSPASKVIAWLLPNRSRPPPNACRPPPRRSSAAWAASLMRSTIERSDPAPPADGRRRQPSGKPHVAKEDSRCEQERRGPKTQRRADPCPEDRIEPDAAEPQRVGPRGRSRR